MAINYKLFAERLLPYANEDQIAVALSGGGDSMALTSLLSDWCETNAVKLHILHVNHNLRAESKDEAKQVKQWIKDIPHYKFKVLNWTHQTSITKKIQEQARDNRYRLMADYCKQHKVQYLCVAHHADDQAETILFRLAKGSGIDGLVGMQFEQLFNKDIIILRPLLNHSHDDLIEYCKQTGLKYFEDPSNKNEQFARVRLRNARTILESEGLTAARLQQISNRLARAREALNFYCSEFLKNHSVGKNSINLIEFKSLPMDIMIRVLQHLIEQTHTKQRYPAPLENIELIAKMIASKTNGRATIAHCLISWSKTSTVLKCEPEHQAVKQ